MREGSPPSTCHLPYVTCHVSHVTCHVSHVTCHCRNIYFFTVWWSYSVEGLLSTGPTPSSFFIIRNIFDPDKFGCLSEKSKLQEIRDPMWLYEILDPHEICERCEICEMSEIHDLREIHDLHQICDQHEMGYKYEIGNNNHTCVSTLLKKGIW